MTGAETPPAVFALLDDAEAGEAGACRLYTGYSHQQRCTDPATLDACWAAVAADQQRGLHAVLLADYEWGARLQGAGVASLSDDDPACLRVLLFTRHQYLSRADTEAWLRAVDEGSELATPAGVIGLRPSVDEADFHAAIAAIHEAIRNGETYQVNLHLSPARRLATARRQACTGACAHASRWRTAPSSRLPPGANPAHAHPCAVDVA